MITNKTKLSKNNNDDHGIDGSLFLHCNGSCNNFLANSFCIFTEKQNINPERHCKQFWNGVLEGKKMLSLGHHDWSLSCQVFIRGPCNDSNYGGSKLWHSDAKRTFEAFFLLFPDMPALKRVTETNRRRYTCQQQHTKAPPSQYINRRQNGCQPVVNYCVFLRFT